MYLEEGVEEEDDPLAQPRGGREHRQLVGDVLHGVGDEVEVGEARREVAHLQDLQPPAKMSIDTMSIPSVPLPTAAAHTRRLGPRRCGRAWFDGAAVPPAPRR